MRRRLAIFSVALALLTATILIGVKLVHRSWNQENAGRTIGRWASSSLAGRGPDGLAMRFGSVEWPYWGALRSLFGGPPVRIVVRDYSIYDPEGHEVLSAAEVRTGVELDALVWHKLLSSLPGVRGNVQLRFHDAEVTRARCRIAPDKDGKVNLVAAFKRRATDRVTQKPTHPSDGGGILITVGRSTVTDSAFSMHFPAWEGDLEDMALRQEGLRYSSFPEDKSDKGPAFTFALQHLAAPRGHVTIGRLHFPLDTIDVSEFRADAADRQNMHIAMTTRCLGAKVAAKGALLDLYAGKARGADLHLVAKQGRRVLASLPWNKVVHGDADATLHIAGTFRDTTLSGEASQLDATMDGIEVTQASGTYHLHEHSARFTKVHANVGGGHADARAVVRLTDMAFQVEVEPHEVHPGQLVPLEILAAITGIFSKKSDTGELVDDLHRGTIDVKLYRHGRTQFPHRVVITKGSAPPTL